jgi:hypothetical protein
LVLGAVVVMLVLPLLLLLDLSNAFDDSGEIPDHTRIRLERIQADRAFRATPTGTTETGEEMRAEVCEESTAAPAHVRRAFEFSGSPDQLMVQMTKTFTTHGWTATPSISPALASFERSFGRWSGQVLLEVEPRGVALLEGWVHDVAAACVVGID